MEKAGRNDPCPCGSGKKYKKCCWEKNERKKFTAQVIPADQASKAQKLSTSFFQKKLAPTDIHPPGTHPDQPL